MDALALLNGAIRESGIDLDSLSISEWASPPEKMHERFKEWVDQAWRDIQTERQGWEFMQRNGMTLISPRILVSSGNRATAPPVDATYLSEETESEFTVLLTTTLSGAWASGTAEAYIDLKEISGEFVFNEDVDEVTPTPASSIFRIKGWGRYDLASTFSDLHSANTADFYVQSTGGSSIQTNSGQRDMEKLIFMPWASWNDNFESSVGGSRGRPVYFTKTGEGTYDFWPRPDQQYLLKASYTAEPVGFTDDAEEPDLPSQYHPVILWLAVVYYADYERQPDLWSRAERRYKYYKRMMDKDLKPRFTMPRNRYNG